LIWPTGNDARGGCVVVIITVTATASCGIHFTPAGTTTTSHQIPVAAVDIAATVERGLVSRNLRRAIGVGAEKVGIVGLFP